MFRDRSIVFILITNIYSKKINPCIIRFPLEWNLIARVYLFIEINISVTVFWMQIIYLISFISTEDFLNFKLPHLPLFTLFRDSSIHVLTTFTGYCVQYYISVNTWRARHRTFTLWFVWPSLFFLQEEKKKKNIAYKCTVQTSIKVNFIILIKIDF